MINNHYEDELTGVVFAILYLIRDCGDYGLKRTQRSLLLTLGFLLQDCEHEEKRFTEFQKIIDICLASMNMGQEDLDEFLAEVEMLPSVKLRAAC